jgi:hypothetical protein
MIVGIRTCQGKGTVMLWIAADLGPFSTLAKAIEMLQLVVDFPIPPLP